MKKSGCVGAARELASASQLNNLASLAWICGSLCLDVTWCETLVTYAH